jgi:hypothetical protein
VPVDRGGPGREPSARAPAAARASWLAALLAIGLLSDGWSTIPAAPAPAAFPDEARCAVSTVLALPIGNLQDFGPQYRAVSAAGDR